MLMDQGAPHPASVSAGQLTYKVSTCLTKCPIRSSRHLSPPRRAEPGAHRLAFLWGNAFGTQEESPPPSRCSSAALMGLPQPRSHLARLQRVEKGGRCPSSSGTGRGKRRTLGVCLQGTSGHGTLRGTPIGARSASLSSSVQPHRPRPWHRTVPLRSPPRGSGSPARPGADVPSAPQHHGRDLSEPGRRDPPGSSARLCPCSPCRTLSAAFRGSVGDPTSCARAIAAHTRSRCRLSQRVFVRCAPEGADGCLGGLPGQSKVPRVRAPQALLLSPCTHILLAPQHSAPSRPLFMFFPSHLGCTAQKEPFFQPPPPHPPSSGRSVLLLRHLRLWLSES